MGLCESVFDVNVKMVFGYTSSHLRSRKHGGELGPMSFPCHKDKRQSRDRIYSSVIVNVTPISSMCVVWWCP